MSSSAEKLKKLGPLLAQCVKEETSLNIDVIVDEFIPILTEFLLFSEPFIQNEAYKTMLYGFIEKLKKLYPKLGTINTLEMHVRVGQYDISVWGPLYWNFMHYTSILVNYAMRHQMMRDVGDFPSLIMNVDHMLPCSQCIAHYRSIKHTPQVHSIIKEISYGQVVEGTWRFHNTITQNINTMTGVNKVLYSMYKFGLKYRVVELIPSNQKHFVTYIPCELIFAPRIDLILTRYFYYKIKDVLSYVEILKLFQTNVVLPFKEPNHRTGTFPDTIDSLYRSIIEGNNAVDQDLQEFYPDLYKYLTKWVPRLKSAKNNVEN